MGLRETTTRYQFSGGIERKMGEQSVPTTRLLALEDAVFTKAVSLTKRDGYESLGKAVLGSATPYSLERGLGARGNEVVLFIEGSSLSYVEGSSAWSSIPDGVMSIRQSDRSLVKTISNQTAIDYAAVGGISLVAWEDSRGGVYYAVQETDGGRVTIKPTQASSTGTRPRCVRAGGNLVLLWADAGGLLKSLSVTTDTPNVASATQTILNDLVPALPNFDAVYSPDAGGGMLGAGLAWNAVSGIRIGWLTPRGALGTLGAGWSSPVTWATTAAVTAGPTIDATPNGAYWPVAWAEGGDAWATLAEASSQPIALIPPESSAPGPVSIDRIAVGARGNAAGDSTVAMDVWIEDRAIVVRNSVVWHSTVSYNSLAVTPLTWAAATPDQFRGAVLASSGWQDIPTGGTSRGYITLLHPTPLQATYFTVRDDGLVVAQTVPGNAGDPPGHRLPRVTDPDGDRTYNYTVEYKGKLDAVNGDQFTETGPRLVALDFDAADAYQTVYQDRTLYLGSAITQAYDGVSWVEACPLYAPDWVQGDTLHTASNTGTGAIANGTYNYRFWYEATLANGQIIRGPVSKPYAVTMAGADDSVSINVPTLRAGAWGRSGGSRDNCRLCAARTVAGDTSTYYRITSMDPSTEFDPNGYVQNTQLSDVKTVIDEWADATLTVQGEPIYTTGGVPSNDAISPSGIIFAGNTRLFVGASGNPNAVYFSQEQADGFTAEFTPELIIVKPQTGGAIAGGVVFDDRILLLAETACYFVTGTGPLPNPALGGEWSTPAGLPPGVGCIDQRTIAVYELGCVFNSKKGRWSIDRGMQASYIGAPVEAYNTLTPVRTTTSEDASEIVFLHSDGVALHYNTLFGQWGAWKNHQGIDAVIVNGLYHYLRTDGRVFRRTPGVYQDADLHIREAIETAWIVPSEARQGQMHLWTVQILGVWLSAHTLSVQWMFDFDVDGNWSEPATFDATDMGGGDYGDGNYGDGDYGGEAPQRYQWEVFIGRPCQAIRFRFTFPEAAGSFGACAELTEIKLTYGVLGNLNQLPASRKG